MVTDEETNRGETSNKLIIATPMIATSNRVVCNVLRGAADWTSTSSEILLLKVAKPAWVIQ